MPVTPAAEAAGGDRGPDFAATADRVRALAWRTPVVPLDIPGAGPVALKLESLQRTGSFKVRGAANRLLKLSARERAAGVVAASSGNHGRAVAEVAGCLGVPATVCVPDWVDPSKLAGIRAAGAQVVLAGPGYDDAEDRAATIAAARGMAVVHAFDDPDVIEGRRPSAWKSSNSFPALER